MNKKIAMGILSILVLTLILISLWLIINGKNQAYPTIFNNLSASFPNVEAEASYQYLSGEQEVNCTFRNNSDYSITMGEEFYLEYKKDDTWYEMANIRGKRGNEGNWNAIAYNLEADTVKDIAISLNNFSKLKRGNYRIVKVVGQIEKSNPTVVDLPSGKNYILVLEFEVK